MEESGASLFDMTADLVSKGFPTAEIVRRVEAEGKSRATVMRWLKIIREGQDGSGKQERAKEQKPRVMPTDVEIVRPVIESIKDRQSAKIMAAAADMETVRHKAMADGEGQDFRIAIGAAQAEAQILLAAARLAKEMREASQGNIALHPQHAQFRTELLDIIKGTDAEGKVLSLFDQWLEVSNEQSRVSTY